MRINIHPEQRHTIRVSPIKLFAAKSGSLTAVVSLESGVIRHLHSIVAPERESDDYRNLELWGDLIVFAGVALGYHLLPILDRLPLNTRLILIDYYSDFIDRITSQLPSNRRNFLFTICSGENEVEIRERLTAFLYGMSTQATVQIIRHPASHSLHSSWYSSMVNMVCSTLKKSGNSGIHRRLPKPLIIDSGFFLETGMRHAFRELIGCEPIVWQYCPTEPLFIVESRLQHLLQKNKIDFLLSINMRGFDGVGMIGEITRRLGIAVAVWFVDDPRPILLQQQPFVKDHFIAFSWDKAYLPMLRQAGFGAAYYLPLAADPSLSVFEGTVEPTIPISFVGTSMSGAFLASIRRKFLWSDSLQPIIDETSEWILKNPPIALTDVAQEYCRKMGMSPPFSDRRNSTWLNSYIIHTASTKKRHRLLGTLVSEGLEIFGDQENWRAMLGPQVHVHPPVDAERGLSRVYRMSAVSINITSCQMPTALNLRVYEVPLAGGFLLSDNQSDLHQLFACGKEAITYSSPEELLEKTKYYLLHSHERTHVTHRARRRVLAEHTCAHRAQFIANMLFSVKKN